jgi:cytochrome c553
MKNLFLSLAAISIIACGSGQTVTAPAPSEAPQDETKAPATPEATALTDMHGHFEDINAIQLALISGNLISARALAKNVRLGFAGPSPEGWEPFIARSVASAEMLEVTDDLEMAARLASIMASTCGDCHRAQDLVVISHVAIAPPKEEDRLTNFMTQHRWAADRMWEGIIGPSDEAWQAGARALQNTELTKEDIDQRIVVTPYIEEMLVQIRIDAAAASSTEDSEERQKLYGRFLSGCASCHRDMKNQLD